MVGDFLASGLWVMLMVSFTDVTQKVLVPGPLYLPSLAGTPRVYQHEDEKKGAFGTRFRQE